MIASPQKESEVASGQYQYPVAIARIEGDESRTDQSRRAIAWLGGQQGGSIVVVTPQKQGYDSAIMALVSQPGVTQLSWKGFNAGYLDGHRVVYAWPDRRHLNDLWDASPDALVVIEHGGDAAAEWIEDAGPVLLLRSGAVALSPPAIPNDHSGPMPADVVEILEYVTRKAAGYDSGLKWNEEDKLKADMMNRPERWADITVEQVRSKLRDLGMRPADIDTIADYVQRRRDGRRFNVRSSYRTFRFN